MMGTIPFRIKIGITGTRNLTNSEKIALSLQTFFTSTYQEAFDSDGRHAISSLTATPVELTLISPLAEGADRLAARVALQCTGTRLEVILPIVQEDYCADFHSNDSRNEFLELLALAQRVSVASSSLRPECYQLAGKAVVDACDILVAIWDGEPSRGRGGTAGIVDLAVKQGKTVFIISPNSPGEIVVKNGGRLRGSHLSGLEDFNALPLDGSEFQKSVTRQSGWLFNAPAAESVSPATRERINTHLIPTFVRAEAVAAHYQGRYLRAGLFGYLIALLSVAILAIAIVLFHDNLTGSSICYGIELTALATVFIMIHRAHKAGVHEKWLASRALAERLRNAFYFVACDLSPTYPQINVDENPLYSGEKEWIGSAFSEVCAGLPPISRPDDTSSSARAQYIKTCWVNEQIAYHQLNVQGSPDANVWIRRLGTQRCDDLLRRLAFGSFFGALLISALHLSFALFELHGGWVKLVEEALTIIAIVLPVAGATFNGYRSLMEFSRMEANSKIMQSQLRRIAPLLDDVQNSKDLEQILRKVEELMLMESQDWVRLMKFSDLERVA